MPGHRPGVPRTPGHPGGFQKIYVIFSYVPFLLPKGCGRGLNTTGVVAALAGGSALSDARKAARAEEAASAPVATRFKSLEKPNPEDVFSTN